MCSSSVPLSPAGREAALDLYRSAEIVFPLIGAVLLERQDGWVEVDDPVSPSHVYVEHAFGFAQFYGKPNLRFEANIAEKFLRPSISRGRKIRLYAPRAPEFLQSTRFEAGRRTRQRFKLVTTIRTDADALHDVRAACHEDVGTIEKAFGIVRRFWRNEADFLNLSNAMLAFRNGELAAICYAAAEADGGAEIDIATRPELRRRGLARDAAAMFIDTCHKSGVKPLWDCFTNNEPSMQLARDLGFEPEGTPYSFYTMEC